MEAPPHSTSDTALAIQVQLEQLGFPAPHIRAALKSLGVNACFDDALQFVLSSHPNGEHILSSSVSQRHIFGPAFKPGQSAPSVPPTVELTEEAWECSICFTSQDGEGWRCPTTHRYCSECMRHHAQSVPFPRCPGCNHELTENDLQEIKVPEERLQAFRDAKLQGAIDALGAGGSAEAAASSRPSSSECGETIMRCTNPACANAVLVDQQYRLRYACPCGAAAVCTHCRQSPYHFHASCADVQMYRRQWLDWISFARDDYFGRARESSRYDAQAQALQEGLDRHKELEADEAWKAENCRLCPHCARPVQKMEGCNAMTCGSDAHGGNTQDGCGKRFDWSDAKTYKTSVQARELPKITADSVRCRGASTLHAFVNCSLCKEVGKGIVGPRFRCLHCESFNVCIKCEPRLADLHEPGHVFQIMFESGFSWSGWRLPSGTKVHLVRCGDALPTSIGKETGRPLEGLCGTVAPEPSELPKLPNSRKRKRPSLVVAHAYQWQGDDGEWHTYDDATNALLSVAAIEGGRRLRVTLAGRSYELHLATMRQRNLSAVSCRPMRAAPGAEVRAGDYGDEQQEYVVRLDDGQGEVRVKAPHVEPVLALRADFEQLLQRLMAGDDERGVRHDSLDSA